MKMCGLSVSDSNFGIQWHIVAMYGPSFFTGSLIARFGAPRIVALGLLLEAGGATVGLSGTTAMHFWATLAILGIGWNFSFVGASALVLETHRPQERNKVQAFNDFLVFGMMAVGSFSSGELLANYGWSAVQPRGVSRRAAGACGIDRGLKGKAAPGEAAGAVRISRSGYLTLRQRSKHRSRGRC
jgi:MFS family permease